MNYLAHLFLAGKSAESLIGNLAGDFVKGRIGDDVPAGIADGIRQHRRIDAFTDSHPSVSAFRRVLIPEHGHYSRIIADVFFDHFLAIDFTRYAAEPLDDFLRRVYATIDPHVDELPGRLRFVYPRMRDEGWLESINSSTESASRSAASRIVFAAPTTRALGTFSRRRASRNRSNASSTNSSLRYWR